jgi:hypothetical protein
VSDRYGIVRVVNVRGGWRERAEPAHVRSVTRTMPPDTVDIANSGFGGSER